MLRELRNPHYSHRHVIAVGFLRGRGKFYREEASRGVALKDAY